MKSKIISFLLILSFAIAGICDGESFTIHVIGDSTVANYNASAYPQTGWGQVIGSFFNASNAKVNNVAIGGRSSKTFYTDGRLAALKATVKSGDYMLVQFGHNDRYFGNNARQVPLDSFAYFLNIYIDSARSWKAVPVLVSPMVMNAWSGTTMRNVFTENGANYRGVMETLAKEKDVPFIDLNTRSFEDYKKWGQKYITAFIYHHYDAGDYPNFATGSNDGTHFQENGSVANARFVADGARTLSSLSWLSNSAKQTVLPLVAALKTTYPITVKANISTSGMITRSALFPQGAPLTLRVIPGSGEVFEYWADEQCKNVSTAKIYYGIQAPSKATTYTAMFRGGSACVAGAAPSSSSQQVISSSSLVLSSSSSIKASPVMNSWIDMAFPDSAQGTTDSNHQGYSGMGFLNIDNVSLSKAYYLLNSTVATTNGILGIRYANGSTETRGMKLYLDGWAYTVMFPPTADWTTWDTVFVEEVWMDAVDMSLILESVSVSGGPNIDAIGFSVAEMKRVFSTTSIATRNGNLKLASPWLVEGDLVEIHVFDALGLRVIKETKQGVVLVNWSALSNSLSSGVYFLKVRKNGAVFLEKRLLKK